MECAHEICSCQVTGGEEYCSETCSSDVASGPYCGCGHAECESAPPRAMPPIGVTH